MDNDESTDGNEENSLSVDLSQGENADSKASEGEEEYTPDEDVPTTDASQIPEVNSADDAVDGDEDRKQRLMQKAREMAEEAEQEDEDDEGTPVDLGDDAPDYADDETIDKADSLFTDEEAEEIDEAMGDFELEPLDDIPDDFDYEAQDTSGFGVEEKEIDIRHNGTIFRLEQPKGMKDDKFWESIQRQRSLSSMFDTMIRYTVKRPEDIEKRMEEENWTSFAKAGLAMKCSSFLGLDALQDF